MKVKKIFTKKVAYDLISKNYNLIGMEDNLKKPWLKVFLFEETGELLQELDLISNK